MITIIHSRALPVLTILKTRQLALYSKFQDGEPKWDKQIYTFMFNLQMDFNIKAFKYYGNITVPLQKCSRTYNSNWLSFWF